MKKSNILNRVRRDVCLVIETLLKDKGVHVVPDAVQSASTSPVTASISSLWTVPSTARILIS